MQTELIIFQLIVLLYSVILHEIAHGWAALKFGDHTAEYMGRLTLNPIPHLDRFGSIILPLILYISQIQYTSNPILFGWAKPVPVNESNLKPYRLGSFAVSVAGVATNALLALFFIIIGVMASGEGVKALAFIGAAVNMALALFNLIPLPPADGYRIIENFLPWQLRRQVDTWLQQYTLPFMIVSIIVATFIFREIFPVVAQVLGQIIF